MRLGICLLLAFALLSCKTDSFPPFEHVSRIEVRTKSDAPISTITDKSQVASILAFVNARSDQWDTPWYGVPVPTVVVDLYAGTVFWVISVLELVSSNFIATEVFSHAPPRMRNAENS